MRSYSILRVQDGEHKDLKLFLNHFCKFYFNDIFKFVTYQGTIFLNFLKTLESTFILKYCTHVKCAKTVL